MLSEPWGSSNGQTVRSPCDAPYNGEPQGKKKEFYNNIFSRDLYYVLQFYK